MPISVLLAIMKVCWPHQRAQYGIELIGIFPFNFHSSAIESWGLITIRGLIGSQRVRIPLAGIFTKLRTKLLISIKAVGRPFIRTIRSKGWLRRRIIPIHSVSHNVSFTHLITAKAFLELFICLLRRSRPRVLWNLSFVSIERGQILIWTEWTERVVVVLCRTTELVL